MGLRILVIDDDRDFNRSLCDLLAVHGHEPTPVLNGCEGLNAVCRCEFDAICLDISLPDEDGLRICQRIRSVAVADDLLIIGISGWSWAARLNRRSALMAGCDLYLTKPVDFAELQAAFERRRLA